MLVSIICCDCRWSCHRGDPSGGTCPSQEKTRISNAAALKAAEELRAEKAAHCESKDKMAKMAVKLKDTADHCQFLEEENRVRA